MAEVTNSAGDAALTMEWTNLTVTNGGFASGIRGAFGAGNRTDTAP